VGSSFHKQLVTLKRPYTLTRPHGVTAQKYVQALWIITAIKTLKLFIYLTCKTKSPQDH